MQEWERRPIHHHRHLVHWSIRCSAQQEVRQRHLQVCRKGAENHPGRQVSWTELDLLFGHLWCPTQGEILGFHNVIRESESAVTWKINVNWKVIHVIIK